MTIQEEDEPLTVSKSRREAAHGALDRWLHECEREAGPFHQAGLGGYLGRFELRASVDDTDVTLHIERSFLVGL